MRGGKRQKVCEETFNTDIMCYGIVTGSPGTPGRSLERFLSGPRAGKQRVPPGLQAGDTARFGALSAAFPCCEGRATATGLAGEVPGEEAGTEVLGWKAMAEMRPDPRHVSNLHTNPRSFRTVTVSKGSDGSDKRIVCFL